jgi:DnaJ family protein C protein 3
VRECLKLDPDHKECFPFYKKVKKLSKQMESTRNFINEEKWEECISKADGMLTTEPTAYHFVLRAKGHKCHCYSKVVY